MGNTDCQQERIFPDHKNNAKAATIRRTRLACFILGFLCLTIKVHSEDPVTLRQDRLFVNQLLRRNFFDLARHHCGQQQAAATSIDSKANWQLRLSEIYEQQGWFSDTDNRNGMLRHAAEQITEFLDADRPSAKHEFLLRIQQARLLTQAIRMELVVAEGGHLFGRGATKNRIQPVDQRAHQTRLDLLNRSLELVVALTKQLEQLRGDLDPQVVRGIRDKARLEQAETLVLQYRIKTKINQATPQQLAKTEEAIKQASHSADAADKSKAQLLLTELSLIQCDRETFQLRVRSVSSKESREPFLPEFLVARSKLFHQEASDALRDLEDNSIRTSLQKQQREWLRLECRLGNLELADELQNAEMRQEASTEFDLQLKTSEKILNGVFRDAARRTVQRFHLVNVVGVEVADLVELLEIQKTLNQPREALRLIERTLQKLPPDSFRAIAAVKLRSGEIHIAEKSWPEAAAALKTAESLYEKLDMIAEHAAADLLRIYVLSQQLASGDAVTEQQYTAALETHIRSFPNQTTCVRAMDWLFNAVKSKDSVRAAELALRMLRLETKPRQKTDALERLGHLLVTAETSVATMELVEDFISEFQQLSSDKELFPAVDLIVVRQQVLEFRFARAVRQNQKIAEFTLALTQLRRDLKLAGHLPKTKVDYVKRRCDLLDAAVTARSIRPAGQARGVEERLTKTDDLHLHDTIQFLFRQYQHHTVQAGNVWLATINERLLRRVLENQPSDDPIEMLVDYLPVVRTTSAITNDVQLLHTWIETLLSKQLSAAHIARIAEVLSGGQPAAGRPRALRNFWQMTAKSNPQGTALWLESQLQLAQLSHRSGNSDGAKRRIGVVDALYPSWGSQERKEQARQFSEDELGL